MNEAETFALVAIATVMALFDALIVKWAADAKTRTSAAMVVFLAFMMLAMLGGALLYYLQPSPGSLIAALWFASVAMSLSVFPLFWQFLSEARRQVAEGAEYVPTPVRRRRTFGLFIVATVVANEFLMGWTFQLASGISPATGSIVTLIAFGVNSAWFLLPMSLEMATAAILLRARFPRGVWALLIAQSGLMFLAPPAIADATWVAATVYGGAALMIGIFVYLMEYAYRVRSIGAAFSEYLVLLLGVYALMMAGLYLWLHDGNGTVFAVSVLLEMVVFFDAVIANERFSAGEPIVWQERPNWAFSVLGLIFVAEVFMGAVLEFQMFPSDFLAAHPMLALSGDAGNLAYASVYNGFWFAAQTTGSFWFLAMMGTEMGALVVFKFLESHNREHKVRLALMMGSYGAFAVFFPSVFYSQAFPAGPSGVDVPVLGWSMGIGSAPLAPTVFVVLGVSYLLVGALAVLFGRRVVCSVFCTAPLMFQGTTIDAMKSFNRTSPVGHRFVGSRISTAYSLLTVLTLGSLVVASITSYLNAIGRWNVTWLGEDPTVFLFSFYFSILWYAMFVLIPYTGNYNCVTMGWCYTGTITQFFGRLGPSRLKVRDRKVCQSCTTIDCAKSCPVGLVDMPGYFRTTGEFRSSKCCGVGNCAEACPYGNLYLYDVRHWVRERLGRPAAPDAAVRLPMLRT